MVPLTQAVPLPEGSYYGAELIGVRVVAETGEPVGTLREVIATGSNDVLHRARTRRRSAGAGNPRRGARLSIPCAACSPLN